MQRRRETLVAPPALTSGVVTLLGVHLPILGWALPLPRALVGRPASRARSRCGRAPFGGSHVATASQGPTIGRRHTGCGRRARRGSPRIARGWLPDASSPPQHACVGVAMVVSHAEYSDPGADPRGDLAADAPPAPSGSENANKGDGLLGASLRRYCGPSHTAAFHFSIRQPAAARSRSRTFGISCRGLLDRVPDAHSIRSRLFLRTSDRRVLMWHTLRLDQSRPC